MPKSSNTNLIGKVCSCLNGSVGLITGLHTTKQGRELWHGIAIEGGTWQSVNPHLIADSLADYINNKVEERLHAKCHRICSKGN